VEEEVRGPGVSESREQIDTERVQSHLDEVVPSTVEETAEANLLCGARNHKGTEVRRDTRAALDFSFPNPYDLLNVEVREFTFNRCPIR